MRIDSFQPSQNVADSEQVKRRQTDKSAEAASASAQDRASISSTAANLQQKLAAAPDIRQDRVNAIKQAMDSGTYNVSNSQLADALHKEFFNRG